MQPLLLLSVTQKIVQQAPPYSPLALHSVVSPERILTGEQGERDLGQVASTHVAMPPFHLHNLNFVFMGAGKVALVLTRDLGLL